MAGGQEAPYRVVGIVDDRDSRTGRQIRGVRVMGGLDELPALIERLGGQGIRPQRLVLTRARMEGADRTRVVEGKRVWKRVELGGRRIVKKEKRRKPTYITTQHE